MDTPQWIDLTIKNMNEISASWDGTSPGVQEERAGTAQEIVGLLQEVKELFNNL